MDRGIASLGEVAAFVLVVYTAVLASQYVLRSYQPTAPRGLAASPRSWFAKWEFAPQDLGPFSYWRLAVASLLVLFLELLMIRWVSSEVRIFAYFKNFVLIACFLGFGLGCYLCRRRINWLAMLFPLFALVFLVASPWDGLRVLLRNLPVYFGATSEVHIWGVPSAPLNWASLAAFLMGVALAVSFFVLVCFLFIPLGQLVGWYLENAPHGIFGYSLNILASLSGIALYTLLCFLYQPPAVWFLVAGAVQLLLVWTVPRLRWTTGLTFALCVLLVGAGVQPGSSVYWSPYQKLAVTPRGDAGRVIAYDLNVNDSWYQQVLDLSPEFVASHPEFFRGAPVEWNAYNLPYHFYAHPPAVLVLGSGMGNDVAAALRNAAGQVVAVEIDPLILQLGERLHFEKPYDSPRVRRVLNDARSYIQNSEDRFDLIMFSLLDSHTNLSHFSNIRIDNFVYTKEALQAARRLLRPDGIFIIKFQVNTPWIAGRLHHLMEATFGRPPIQVQAEDHSYTTGGRFFIAGSPERIARALADPALAAYVQQHAELPMESAALTTDDWPYFYQHAPGLPLNVLVISLVLVVLCRLLLRRTLAAGGSLRWHFFFLGAGFMLLEAQIISKMALLFGTTWVVNSVVIGGLLLLIVGANLLVAAKRDIPVTLAYGGIFASMLAAFLVPVERFFFSSLWLKALTATVVLCLPVFFAGVVFIRSFARAAFSGAALGSNLLGALVGGLLESLSFWIGLKSLLILAALLYLLSWVALRREAWQEAVVVATPESAPAPSERS